MRSFFKFLLFSLLAIFIIWICYHFLFQKGNAQQSNTLRSNSTEEYSSTSTSDIASATRSDSNLLSEEFDHNPIPDEKLLPKCTLKGQFIQHQAYELYYVDEAEQAAWVAYTLTDDHLNGPYHRSNNFETDPLVKQGSADDLDYSHSGFDRGHLAPAADFSWSRTAMEESFYYSNMTPQDPSFNRGKWKELEEQVRDWAALYEYVTVITGPVLTSASGSIGHDHVLVPKQFYKIILTSDNGQAKAIGFLMENHALHSNLTSYATSIDNIEKISGLNFFEGLSDSLENKIESTVNIQQWDFVSKGQHSSSSNQKNYSHESTICKGTTKAGNPCKNHTKNANGYCQHHQSQAQ